MSTELCKQTSRSTFFYPYTQGDIVFADLNGLNDGDHVLKKHRPFLIIQNDVANANSPVLIGAPITGLFRRVNDEKVQKPLFLSQCKVTKPYLHGLEKKSIIRFDCLTTIDRSRVTRVEPIGNIPPKYYKPFLQKVFFTPTDRVLDVDVKQGDVVNVDFGENYGCEVGRVRPAVVVSVDYCNLAQTLLVVPCSRIKHDYMPTHLRIEDYQKYSLKNESMFLFEHIRCVDKSKVQKKHDGTIKKQGELPKDLILKYIDISLSMS